MAFLDRMVIPGMKRQGKGRFDALLLRSLDRI